MPESSVRTAPPSSGLHFQSQGAKKLVSSNEEACMRYHSFRREAAIVLIGLLILSTALISCSTVKSRGGTQPGDEGVGKYYFFDDVLVPKELTYQPGQSFIYETPQFKTGSMTFTKFWLDTGSLIDFFVYHMEKDNWKLVNSFKGKESEINFSKPDKTCRIKIMEKWYGMTEVEIRVGPFGTQKM
jgi:hypothetical protein